MFFTLLDAAASPAKQNPLMGILPFVVMFAIMYFLMIRPQQKKQKEMQKMLDELKVGDKVVTASGIIGQITNFKENKQVAVIKVDNNTNTKIEFQRSAVAGVINEKKETDK